MFLDLAVTICMDRKYGRLKRILLMLSRSMPVLLMHPALKSSLLRTNFQLIIRIWQYFRVSIQYMTVRGFERMFRISKHIFFTLLDKLRYDLEIKHFKASALGFHPRQTVSRFALTLLLLSGASYLYLTMLFEVGTTSLYTLFMRRWTLFKILCGC